MRKTQNPGRRLTGAPGFRFGVAQGGPSIVDAVLLGLLAQDAQHLLVKGRLALSFFLASSLAMKVGPLLVQSRTSLFNSPRRFVELSRYAFCSAGLSFCNSGGSSSFLRSSSFTCLALMASSRS